VIVPLLSAIVAAQAIALVLFVRQPVTVAALPPGPAPTPPVKASAIVAPEATSGVAEVRPTDTALSVDGEAGAAVFIDGRRSGVAPLKMTGLTAGRHQVRLSTTIGTATQDVTIAPGSSTSLIFPSPGSGWIDLRIPFRVSVFEGSRQVAVSGDGPISLPAGTHTLTLRNDDLGFRSETRVTVSGGRMAAVRPVLPDGVLQVNALPWANVYVDGEPVGDTPIGQLRVAVGPHEVRVVHPQLGERVQRVDVPAQRPARVSVDLR
jgi:hypothetical protein